MPILEALIYTRPIKKVILRSIVKSHNMESYIHKILSVNKQNEQYVYQLSQDFLVSILQADQNLFLCLHTSEVTLHKAFHFLTTFKTNFLRRTLEALETNNTRGFTLIEGDLEKLVIAYNLNQSMTGLEVLKDELENVNNLMIENFEKLEERNEKIEVLKNKMRGLALANGYDFMKHRKRVSTDEETPEISQKNKSRKGLWIVVMSLFSMMILGFILAIYICGGYSFDQC